MRSPTSTPLAHPPPIHHPFTPPIRHPGVPPLELLGLSLWSLFTPAGPDAPPDAAAAILRDAEAAAREGKAFALRGARLIGRTADAFDLFFRCGPDACMLVRGAALTNLDQST
jgi:hypothetical protein